MTRVRHTATAFAVLVTLGVGAPVVARAAPSVPVRTTVPEIVRLLPADDGLLVSFQGEAIGEALASDAGFVWVNVLEGGYAIGVNVRRSDVEAIDGFGMWGRTGAIVEVEGTVNVACPDHGGDFDVHARRLRVLDPSRPRTHPITPWKVPAAIVAGLLGSAVFGGLRYARRRAYPG